MSRRLLLTLCFLAIGASSAVAKTKSSALSADGRTAIAHIQRSLQDAVNTGSTEGLLTARADLLALSESDQKSEPARYALTLIDWRVVPLMLNGDPKAKIQSYVDEALAATHAIEAMDPKNGEAFALEASLMGLELMQPGADVMTLGRQSVITMMKATKISPANPRVFLMQGISTLYTPAQFGGGPAAALPILAKADTLAQTETSADSLAPAWGHDDIKVWQAQALFMSGDAAGAKAHIDAALAVNPSCGMTRMVLGELDAASHADSTKAAEPKGDAITGSPR